MEQVVRAEVPKTSAGSFGEHPGPAHSFTWFFIPFLVKSMPFVAGRQFRESINGAAVLRRRLGQGVELLYYSELYSFGSVGY